MSNFVRYIFFLILHSALHMYFRFWEEAGRSDCLSIGDTYYSQYGHCIQRHGHWSPSGKWLTKLLSAHMTINEPQWMMVSLFVLGNSSTTNHGSSRCYQERHGYPGEEWICQLAFRKCSKNKVYTCISSFVFGSIIRINKGQNLFVHKVVILFQNVLKLNSVLYLFIYFTLRKWKQSWSK